MMRKFATMEDAMAAIDLFIDKFKEYYAREIQTSARSRLNSPHAPYGNPTSLTGNLARSIIVRKKGNDWTITAQTPYAESIEYGSRARWVPIQGLKEWAKKRLGNENLAYAIQKTIAKKGTKSQPFMGPAMDDAFTPAYEWAYQKVFS